MTKKQLEIRVKDLERAIEMLQTPFDHTLWGTLKMYLDWKRINVENIVEMRGIYKI